MKRATLIALTALATFAQPTQSFEVASVRMLAGMPRSFSTIPQRTGGQLTWTTTLHYLTTYAYHLPGWRIEGMNPEQSFYAIGATMNPSATEAGIRRMLQQLLADRFQMVAHTETKELSGYALTIAKNGPKLAIATKPDDLPPMPSYLSGKPAAALEGQSFTSAEGLGISAITGRGVPISKLTDQLADHLGTFVNDRTGLTGNYYFGFRFARAQVPEPTLDAASVFAALQDDLGLKLEKEKGPVDVLVITQFSKIPSEN